MCLPLLIFPCTIKSRSSPLAPAHPGGPGKKAIKCLCMCGSPLHCLGEVGRLLKAVGRQSGRCDLERGLSGT